MAELLRKKNENATIFLYYLISKYILFVFNVLRVVVYFLLQQNSVPLSNSKLCGIQLANLILGDKEPTKIDVLINIHNFFLKTTICLCTYYMPHLLIPIHGLKSVLHSPQIYTRTVTVQH